MASGATNKECKHQGCRCAVSIGAAYCGSHCESMPLENGCGCGHSDCDSSNG